MKIFRLHVWLMLLVAAALITARSRAEVSLPRVLDSHMVLQRDMPVPIWGTAVPDEIVTVTFHDQVKRTTTASDGKWLVKLDALSASGPADLSIAGRNRLILKDVTVGEVWVGSGQSNMDTDITEYPNDADLAVAARQNHPDLRLFRSDAGDGWASSGPAPARFSAQLFYFGMLLQKELGVPVGVIEGAVRGSPSANWISDSTVQFDPGIQKAIADREKYRPWSQVQKQSAAILETWKKEVERERAAGVAPEKLPRQPWTPSHPGTTHGPRGDFYLSHIRPVIPFAIRGVLWDQGEGGTNIADVPQDVVMHALIAQWRSDWGEGNFFWLYMQKPSGGGCALFPENPTNKGAAGLAPLPKEPPQHSWDADARLEYLRTMKNPNTYMVPAQDLATGVHPQNKSGYATRDCQVALGAVYAKPVQYSGPTYERMSIEGGKLRLHFSHVGKGLTAPPGKSLQGFAVAGSDKRFFWADAVIDGETVVLSSAKVPAPAAARYGWSWDVSWADLFNADRLPAVSFRTDDWAD